VFRTGLFVAAIVFAPAANAQAYSDAVKQMAERIFESFPARSTVALSIENRSSMQGREVDDIRSSMEGLLRGSGIELGESETKLRITISEDPTRYLFIAPAGTQVIIVGWKKPPATAAEYRIAIKRAPVFEQRDPILDMKLSADGQDMQLLETDRTVEYKRADDRWQFVRATPAAVPVISRDPRGSFAEIPYRMVRGRNYFDTGEFGVYTIADTGTGLLFTGVDGQARLYKNTVEPVVTIRNWGSDVAAIASNCGSKKQVLVTAATATGDAPEHVQAFEFSGSAYSPVTDPLPLPGLVTALWQADATDQATVVVHNRQTGMYEASRLSLSCVQ